MAILEFQCRHRFAGGFELDLAFESDQHFTALFGPSGSGKTTILHVIAGLLRPQAGVVRLSGRALLETHARLCRPPEQRNIGFVFQDALLFPHLTVEGNLRYGIARAEKKPRRVEFSRVVEVLEIGPLLKRTPHNLSGGEKQRVALGRALLRNPQLLVMDEPLAALDDSLRAQDSELPGKHRRRVASARVVRHAQPGGGPPRRPLGDRRQQRPAGGRRHTR